MHFTRMLRSIPESMKLNLLAAFLLIPFLSQAQNIDGTWRVSHAQTTDSTALLATPDSASTDEFIESPAFITYNNLSGVLEINNSKATSHSFVNKPKTQKLRTVDGKLTMKFKGQLIYIEDSSPDSLVLKIEEEPNSILVLYPLKLGGEKIQINDFTNSDWVTSSEDPFFDSWTFHFLDSGYVNTVIKRDDYGTTTSGEWKIYSSNDFYCLYVSDRADLEEYIFYLTDRNGSELSLLIGHQDFEHPRQVELKLKRTTKVTKDELSKTRRNLVGKWSFESFANESSDMMFDSLLNISYSIKFKNDNTYHLINHVEYIEYESKDISNYDQDQQGTWELSNSGDFITITPDENPFRRKRLTIYNLEDDQLSLDINYPYNKFSLFSCRMELKK